MSTGVARIIARSRKRGEGEIRYGRKERGAERRWKIGRPVDWAGREERREEAKKKKNEEGGKERSGSLRHDL